MMSTRRLAAGNLRPRGPRLFGRGIVERQAHDELRALAEPVAVGADLAAVQLDEALEERQPEPQAPAAPIEGRVRLHEGLEEPREHLRRHADARVRDADDGPSPPGSPATDTVTRPPRRVNLAAFWSRLPTTCARRAPSAFTKTRIRRQDCLQTHAVLLEERAMVLDRPPDELVELEPLPLQLDLVLRDARDIEQVVDQVRELPDLPVDDRLGPSRLLAAGHGAVEDVEAVLDGRERVAQFVGEDGQELVLVPVGLAQFLVGRCQFLLCACSSSLIWVSSSCCACSLFIGGGQLLPLLLQSQLDLFALGYTADYDLYGRLPIPGDRGGCGFHGHF